MPFVENFIERVAKSDTPREVLRAPEFRELYAEIPKQTPETRGEFGRAVNELKQAVEAEVDKRVAELENVELAPIDVTAPMDINAPLPTLGYAGDGSIHPLMREITSISDIFSRMGFTSSRSRAR